MGLARVFLLCCVAIGAACSAQRAAEAPMPPDDPSRLSHTVHQKIACTSCHTMDHRPGSDDHKPCDDCHKQAFLSKPGELCLVCHTEITVNPLEAPLKPYPTTDIWQAEPPRFSHQAHLDSGAIEGAVGFHVTCADCHVRDGKLARPDHATCTRCHAPEASPKGLVQMSDCGGCHQPTKQLRVRARLIRGDLQFDHKSHLADRRGVAIKCEQCHAQSTNATDYKTHAPPQIENCVSCHDDTDRAPEAVKMRSCGVCHVGRVNGVVTIAPRNHLPATEKPIDHTIAFRRDHTEAAERDSARCATCHTQMSGNARDTCDECHQTMRPADHRITFRELDHGPEAVADRDRCARCHVVSFCSACHAQRPRSHGFPGDYMTNHGALARANVRPCLTCHVDGAAMKCTMAGCHTTVGAPPR